MKRTAIAVAAGLVVAAVFFLEGRVLSAALPLVLSPILGFWAAVATYRWGFDR